MLRVAYGVTVTALGFAALILMAPFIPIGLWLFVPPTVIYFYMWWADHARIRAEASRDIDAEFRDLLDRENH